MWVDIIPSIEGPKEQKGKELIAFSVWAEIAIFSYAWTLDLSSSFLGFSAQILIYTISLFL